MESQRNSSEEILKGISAIDGASSLVSPDIAPSLSRGAFNQVKAQDAIEANKSVALPAINSHLKKIFEDRINNLFSGVACIEKVDLCEKFESGDIYIWERIFKCTSCFKELIEGLKSSGSLKVQLESGFLKIKTQISNEIDISNKNRQLIYAITRNLLKNGIILSYSIVDEKSDFSEIELKFDCSGVKGKSYIIDFTREQNLLLGLQPQFDNYETDYQSFLNINKSICLEITKNLELKNYGFQEHSIFKKKMSCGFVHIAFLFRPLSLIIPSKGLLMDSSQVYTYTGRENSVKDQSEAKLKKALFKTIDIFEFLRR